MALAQERGDANDAELSVWADAAAACVESHSRDAEILIPWLRMKPQEIIAMAERPREQSPEWQVIAPFFPAVPKLEDAPDRFEAAIRWQCLRYLPGDNSGGRRHPPSLNQVFTNGP